MRFAILGLLLAVVACNKSGAGPSAEPESGVCMTEAARSVTTRPEFLTGYTHCAKGSRAIGRTATLQCLEEQTGLPEACASCYSWYKACVLQSCFNACNTYRPSQYCKICSRTSCRGMFYQCAGTTEVFPDPG